MIPPEIREAFFAQAESRAPVFTLSGGLINSSFRIGESRPVFLQRINKRVFPRPEWLDENYRLLWTFLEKNRSGATPGMNPVRMPAPLQGADGSFLVRDLNGEYWRAFEFIKNTRTLSGAGTPAQAGMVARCFAEFTAAFPGFDMGALHETIPGFHDLAARYRQFTDALNTGLPERVNATASLSDQLLKRDRYVRFYEDITVSSAFSRRVTHHDAKIANILIHCEKEEPVCLVDFDTVMPGYFFSDPGDMIRSMAGNLDENERGVEGLMIRDDFYQAITGSYLQVLGPDLSPAEKKYFHSAGLLIIYMQALRFLADYLQCDTYYRVDYPGQNLDRARNQLTLLMQLEAYLRSSISFAL